MRCSLHILLLSIPLILGIFGCGGQANDDGTSPTPNPVFGESLENQMWRGWHSYEDNTIRINLLTELKIFEYRDGMWCGELGYDIGQVGTYFAYNELGTWVELLNVTPQNVDEYSGLWIFARAYGEVAEDGTLFGWLDAVNDLNVPEPYTVPSMEDADLDFDAKWATDLSMRVDPTTVSLGEYLALMSDAASQTTGGTTGTAEPSAETLALTVDMPSYYLPFYQVLTYQGNENTCGWCMQEDDPLMPTERSHP